MAFNKALAVGGVLTTGLGYVGYNYQLLKKDTQKLIEASEKQKARDELDRNTLRRTIAYLEEENGKLTKLLEEQKEKEKYNTSLDKVLFLGLGALGAKLCTTMH